MLNVEWEMVNGELSPSPRSQFNIQHSPFTIQHSASQAFPHPTGGGGGGGSAVSVCSGAGAGAVSVGGASFFGSGFSVVVGAGAGVGVSSIAGGAMDSFSCTGATVSVCSGSGRPGGGVAGCRAMRGAVCAGRGAWVALVIGGGAEPGEEATGAVIGVPPIGAAVPPIG